MPNFGAIVEFRMEQWSEQCFVFIFCEKVSLWPWIACLQLSTGNTVLFQKVSFTSSDNIHFATCCLLEWSNNLVNTLCGSVRSQASTQHYFHLQIPEFRFFSLWWHVKSEYLSRKNAIIQQGFSKNIYIKEEFRKVVIVYFWFIPSVTVRGVEDFQRSMVANVCHGRNEESVGW